MKGGKLSMGTRGEALQLLCRCLGGGCAGERPPALPDDPEAWRRLIGEANRQFVTPALWRSLEMAGLAGRAPEDAREFMAGAHDLNAARNRAMRSQALELLAGLERRGVDALLLKGAAFLFDGADEDVGRRMMLDLDVLVPAAALDDAVAVACALGYAIVADTDRVTYQYPALGRRGDAATVEFHLDMGEQRHLLPAARAFAEATACVSAGATVRLPSPTHRLLHNAFHAQIQDRGYTLGKIAVRELEDVVRLVERHGPTIDWPFLDAVFARGRYGRAWSAYCYMAHRLLGVPIPRVEASARNQRHLKRCLHRLDRPAVSGALGFWAAATQPLRRCRIEYLYGECAGPLTLALYRVRRTGELVRDHRWRAFARIAALRQHFRA